MNSSLRTLPVSPEEILVKNMMQAAEMMSELNRHGTREEFKIPPDQETDYLWLMHYIHCGRAGQIAIIDEEAHAHLNLWGASQVLGCDVRKLDPLVREEVLFTVWEFWHDLFVKYPEQCLRVTRAPAA